MNDREYALEAMDYFYADGDVDYIFYWQLLGEVTYHTTSSGDDVLLEKTDEQRKIDSLLLASYLISTDDFSAGSTTQSLDNTFNYELMQGGFNEFRKYVSEKVVSDGLDGDWHYEIWLKKTSIGKPPPTEVVEDIVNLFK